MTPFDPDERPRGVDQLVTSLPSPLGGEIAFSTPAAHLRINSFDDPAWFNNWGHGYQGDVYYTEAQSLTITMPDNTVAFYFYVEGNRFNDNGTPPTPPTWTIVATLQDATTSGPTEVISPGPPIGPASDGARYMGFFTTSADNPLVNCTITLNDPIAEGFAIGEFGISQLPSEVVVPPEAEIRTEVGATEPEPAEVVAPDETASPDETPSPDTTAEPVAPGGEPAPPTG